MNYLSKRKHISKTYLSRKKGALSHVYKFLLTLPFLAWITLFGMLQTWLKTLRTQQPVCSFSQADLDDLRTIKVISTEEIKAIYGSLSSYQTSMNDLSTKLDYLENQSRRSNLINDCIPNTKLNRA